MPEDLVTSRWDNKVREGLVIYYGQSTEPSKNGTFLGRVAKFAALEKGLPAITYMIVFVVFFFLLWEFHAQILEAILGNPLGLSVVTFFVFLLIMSMFLEPFIPKGFSPGSLVSWFGKKLFRFVLSVPGAIASAVHEGLTIALIRPIFRDRDRDIPIHTYVIREVRKVPKIGEEAGESRGARQCTVRMRGFHNGAQPQERDFVSFVGRPSRQNIFLSSRGKMKRTGEQVVVNLPHWAR